MQTIQGLAEEVSAEEIQVNAEVGGEVLQRTGMAEMQRGGDQARQISVRRLHEEGNPSTGGRSPSHPASDSGEYKRSGDQSESRQSCQLMP